MDARFGRSDRAMASIHHASRHDPIKRRFWGKASERQLTRELWQARRTGYDRCVWNLWAEPTVLGQKIPQAQSYLHDYDFK